MACAAFFLRISLSARDFNLDFIFIFVSHRFCSTDDYDDDDDDTTISTLALRDIETRYIFDPRGDTTFVTKL